MAVDTLFLPAETRRVPEPAFEMSVFAELELGIGGLDSQEAEEHLARVLKDLNGVHTVRLVHSGAHIIYNTLGITPEEIITTVRQAGFTLATHQKTGEL